MIRKVFAVVVIALLSVLWVSSFVSIVKRVDVEEERAKDPLVFSEEKSCSTIAMAGYVIALPSIEKEIKNVRKS